ncbi:MAG: hypothetical protein ACT4QD_02490 [Acidobacteriota bacterium]
MPTARLVVVLLLLGAPECLVAAMDPSTPGGERLRPHDARSRALLATGLQRSASLRDLVRELEAHDVIVYLQMEPQLSDHLAGTLTWITATPRYRYVRISINRGLSDVLAMATVGHELYHALEIAREPSIVSPESLEAFYRSMGIRMLAHQGGWDTDGARARGELVRREVAASRALKLARADEEGPVTPRPAPLPSGPSLR